MQTRLPERSAVRASDRRRPGRRLPEPCSRVLLAVEPSTRNLPARDQAKRLLTLDKRLGSWARREQDSDVARLAQERLTEPGAARRNVDRPRASWPPGRDRSYDEFLYPCRADRGEVDHAQQFTPRPRDGPRHVRRRRRGNDVGDRGGIA